MDAQGYTALHLAAGEGQQVNHELEMLRDDERKEIRAILRELTRNIRRHLPQIKGHQRGLTELDWIATRTKSLQSSAAPSALEAMDSAAVLAMLKTLDAVDSGDDVAAKEAQKALVQAGLREVATRIAAETPGGASWSPEPMVAELDEPVEMNFVRKHALQQSEELGVTLRDAATRVTAADEVVVE